MAIGLRDYEAAGTPDTRGARALARPLHVAPIDLRASSITPGGGVAAQVATKAPSPDALDYAHKLGQNVVLWGGLLVFGVLLARAQSRGHLLRALARKHVAA